MKPKIKYDEEELGVLEAWETRGTETGEKLRIRD